MTTQTTAAYRRQHGRQDSNGNGAAMALRPQPSSPTLTNPDMILPDYDEPEPLDDEPERDGPQPDNATGWDKSHADQQRFILDDDTPHSNGYPLTTPILYGNGTMLSDIGEVTEVESNAGGPSRLSTRSRLSDHDAALRSSPTMGGSTYIKKPLGANRERRSSIESTSTITTQDKDHAFPDLDDAVSVDDSNFQGDDEESLASSFVDDTPVQHENPFARPNPSFQEQNADRYSTSSISRRAEQILANAKRRLNTMEGNLTRARTFSYSSVSDGSTPSPGRPGATARASNFKSPVHSRNISDNSLDGISKASQLPKRSASALGAAGGYRPPLPSSKSAGAIGRTNHGISQLPLDVALEPLSEDDGDETTDYTRDSEPPSNIGSPTFGVQGEPFPRSVSAAQMRGLQDQMNGLKGKIHTLREQAIADSMKRRSLQSLRTPSPFTHSPWEPIAEKKPPQEQETNTQPALGSPFRPDFPEGEPEVRDVEKGDDGDLAVQKHWPRVERGPVVARHSPVHNLHRAYMQDAVAQGSNGGALDSMAREDAVQEPDDDLKTENGDAAEQEELAVHNGDGVADTASESGDSLYHEAYQHPMSHEDREDAFDYEHFFLYSAMGSLSRQGYRGDDDSASICSEDSVETTKAAPQPLQRRNSIDTLTSVDTFATATEGRSSRTSNADDEDAGRPESPVVGAMPHNQPGIERRATFGGGESGGSSSEDSRSSQERYRHQRSQSYKMGGAAGVLAARHGLNRPSVSSFESTGTNRSFPLVNKTKLSSSTSSTPRDSPDHMVRARSSPMSQNSSSRENGVAKSTVSGVSSPTLMPLSTDDQAAVNRVLSSVGKCVASLRDQSDSANAMHDTYRRRLEAAWQILEGHPDSF